MDLKPITTIFFDVDGVFTDGSLYFSEDGVNISKFNVHDGMGCILLKQGAYVIENNPSDTYSLTSLLLLSFSSNLLVSLHW